MKQDIFIGGILVTGLSFMLGSMAERYLNLLGATATMVGIFFIYFIIWFPKQQ